MKPSPSQDRLLDRVLEWAKQGGADAADVLLYGSTSLQTARRMGKPEHLERSESHELGLRVFFGKKQAIVSSSDLADAALKASVERALAIASAVPPDPFCGLAEDAGNGSPPIDLDLYDPSEPTAEHLEGLCAEAEDAALSVAGVTNSEGAGAGWGRVEVALGTSAGFRGAYVRSSWSVSAAVVAGTAGAMERDYDYTAAVHGGDLRAATEVGRSAGQRAVRRLGPRKVRSAKVPVLFEQRVARSLVSNFSSAINGAAVARGSTFLGDKMGERVFAPGVRIVDDPWRKRGLASRAFDGEGVICEPLNLIADGVLGHWILDSATARKLKLTSNGRAQRSTGAAPSPGSTNLYLAPGSRTPAALIADVEQGFLVTELIGLGVNGVTGDYSRGAAGFWIEKGEIAYPVSEITIAGNLNDMFAKLTPADDLVFRYGTDSPTVRVDGMTIAGL
ncbi:MAG: metallopeptidase TldD-related protein [Proteobacteria bacterium]|nr:metallopeptidase TldD-related protein [Pseudomonadota bacterium]